MTTDKPVVTSGGVAIVDVTNAAKLLKANGVLASARQHMHFESGVAKMTDNTARDGLPELPPNVDSAWMDADWAPVYTADQMRAYARAAIAALAPAEAVAWRYRDDVRPGLRWFVCDDPHRIEQMRADGGYEIEPLYLAAPQREARVVDGPMILRAMDAYAAICRRDGQDEEYYPDAIRAALTDALTGSSHE